MLHHMSRMLQETPKSGVEQHQQRCDPGSGVEQKQRWDPESGVSGTAAEVEPREWSEWNSISRGVGWGAESGVSETASAEVGPREWSEWNSISRGGTQRVE